MARNDTSGAILAALTPPPGEAPASMTLDQLVEATGLPRGPVGCAVRGMIGAGTVTWCGLGRYRWIPPGERVKPPPRPPGRADRDGPRARLWRALRTARKGSVAELVALIARDGENPETLRRPAANYLRALERAGYLIDLRRPGAVPARYSLLRDTGPAAPAMGNGGTEVYDRNTGEVYPIVKAPK